MKKALYATWWLCVGAIHAHASCNACGCSIGGNYFGILPRFQKNFVGVKYQYRSFKTELPTILSETKNVSYETIHTTEVWGRYVPHQRVQLFAFVPYSYNTISEKDSSIITWNGLGDISVMSNIILYNSGDSISKNWKHAIQVGGGIKLPTGKYKVPENGISINQSTQLGTGSIDIPLNAMYTIRYKKMGANAEVNYRINTTNKAAYSYGNRFSSAIRFFYWQKVKSISFLPQAGIGFESAAKDVQHNMIQETTGGNILLGNVGLDMYFGNFSLNLGMQHPLYQKLAKGYTTSYSRYSAGLLYLF